MAIGECSTLPSSTVLASQSRWVFFMPWAELVQEVNTTEEIRRIYNHPRVVTRKQMPGWR